TARDRSSRPCRSGPRRRACRSRRGRRRSAGPRPGRCRARRRRAGRARGGVAWAGSTSRSPRRARTGACVAGRRAVGERAMFRTVVLLALSNTFMPAAWYGHLRFKHLPLWQAVAVSWGIAFFEYVLQVPANRLGYQVASSYQLKIVQEAITLV